MLESCSDLGSCEKVLQAQLGSIALLGEVSLTREDYERLCRYVRAETNGGSTKAMRMLSHEAPASLAYCLVGAGTFAYREGDYWSAVWDVFGVNPNPSRERRLGTFFLRFLENHGLPTFRIRRSHPYVTPILLHGGIPESCLREHFERILLPDLRHDSSSPALLNELVQELRLLRRDEQERGELETRLTALRRQARDLRKRAAVARELIQARDELLDLWAREANVRGLEDLDDLPEAYASCQDTCGALDRELQELVAQQKRVESTLAAYTESDRATLKDAVRFREWACGYPRLMQLMRYVASTLAEVGKLENTLKAQADGVLLGGWRPELSNTIQAVDLERLTRETAAWQDDSIEIEQLKSQLVAQSSLVSQRPGRGGLAERVLAPGGLLLIVLGALTSLPEVLIVAGAVLLGAVGYIHLRSARSTAEETQTLAELEDALKRVEGGRQAHRSQVAESLRGIPVKPMSPERPMGDLPDALRVISKTSNQLAEAQSLLAERRDEIKLQARTLWEIALSLQIEPTDDVAMLAEAVADIIKQARHHHIDAVGAQSELDQTIAPELQRLQSELTSAKAEKLALEGRLARLGEGDVDVGLRKITDLRREAEAAAEQRRKLAVKYPDLERIEKTLREGTTDLEEEAFQVEGQLRYLTTDIADLVAARDHLSIPYQGIDEPVRKYLLYGAASAERFLLHSAALLRGAIRGDGSAEAEGPPLPAHVLAAFGEWWSEYGQRRQLAQDMGVEEDGDGHRFRVPVIGVDPGLAEITVQVGPQMCATSARGAGIELDIQGNTCESRQSFSLPAHKCAPGLYRTESTAVPLLYPSGGYAMKLQSNGETLREWTLPLERMEVSCCLFDARSGRLLPEGTLPRSLVWVVSRNVRPVDQDLVREAGQLYGQWHEYHYWVVDVRDAEVLRLGDAAGKEALIPVADASSADLGLVGAEPLKGITADSVPVYVVSPPRIRIPVKEAAELDLWRLSVYAMRDEAAAAIAYGRLSDFGQALEAHADAGCVDVDLTDENLLGASPVGTFRIHVGKEPYVDWHADLCLAPTLAFSFEKTLYLPCEVGHTSPVHGLVDADEETKLSAVRPAKARQVGAGQFRVEATTAQDSINCRLHCSGISRISSSDLELSARIPKVRWRLQGAEEPEGDRWHDVVDELWLGDWERSTDLFLIVDAGGLIAGNVQLSLPERPSVTRAKTLVDGRARFDLGPFRGELRTLPELQTVAISVPAHDVVDAPLFRVRTRWEATNIECTQRTEQGKIILSVSWAELGQTDGKAKIIRLWRLDSTAAMPTIQMQVNEASHQIQISGRTLTPGEYLIELALEDPWSSTSPSRPIPGSPSTWTLTVAGVRDPLQDETLRVRYIGDWRSGRRYPLAYTYTFHIVGKIVHHKLPPAVNAEGVLLTKANEGWYVAEVDVLDDPEMRDEIREANPLKIEYNWRRKQITSAEDRAGDGAVYCCNCQRLHWRQETIKAEEQRHKVLGPIERFYIS